MNDPEVVKSMVKKRTTKDFYKHSETGEIFRSRLQLLPAETSTERLTQRGA